MKGLYAKIAMCKKIKCTTVPYINLYFKKSSVISFDFEHTKVVFEFHISLSVYELYDGTKAARFCFFTAIIKALL